DFKVGVPSDDIAAGASRLTVPAVSATPVMPATAMPTRSFAPSSGVNREAAAGVVTAGFRPGDVLLPAVEDCRARPAMTGSAAGAGAADRGSGCGRPSGARRGRVSLRYPVRASSGR